MKIDEYVLHRFWSFVDIKEPYDCWEWRSTIIWNGYGRISIQRKATLAHRVSWNIHNERDCSGWHVCHSCDNRKCVNPNHLFLGNNSDNILDSVAKGRNFQRKKTHCPLGHEYSGENLRIKGRRRICRTCSRAKDKIYKLNAKTRKNSI